MDLKFILFFTLCFRILELPFEKAYCQYRLNDLKSAKGTLENISESGLREKELLAQVVSDLWAAQFIIVVIC